MSLDVVTGFAAKLLGSISGRRSPGPRENAAQERRARSLLHPQGYNCPDLTEDRVRVVVFRDDKGVKTPVFDSQVHCEPEEGEKEPLLTKSWGDNMIRHGDRGSQLTESTMSEGWRGRKTRLAKKPSSDSELLGEMMFGSMPMKVAGNTVKIHYIRSTDQLMLTKVFHLKRRIPTQCSLNTEMYMDSCPLSGGQGDNSFAYNVTGPSDTPGTKRSHSLMMPSTRVTNSLCSLPPHSPSSLTHSPPSPHTISISSSYTRRMHRARATSLEIGSELYRKVLKPLDRPPRKGSKYAIGVIVCLSEMNHLDIRHFKNFIFSHFTLIDTHLERLKEGMEEALQTRAEPQRQNMLARAAQAYQSFLDDLLSLYKARRIHSPVWLGLVSEQGRRREICMQFMEELGSIVAEIDTKDTKYFFSTLLTAVLSHHLAWVYTVSRTNDARHARNSKSLGVLAESHPYNPLWAQLGDLFGAVTQPLMVTRTIVTGQSYTLVCRLLYLLTYFIRCSEIQPGVVDTDECPSQHSHHNTSSSSYAGPSRVPLSTTTQLEDSGDIFESRASSAITMCPSPHTPGPAGKETPLIRTHPFSFRSPVPTTPEPRSHSSGHDFQHSSASGSADISDTHSTYRSGSSTDAFSVTASGSRVHTPGKGHSGSLESQNSPRKSAPTSVTMATTDANQVPISIDTVPMVIRQQRDNPQATLDLLHPTSGVPFPFSPDQHEFGGSQSSPSEYTMDRLAVDEDLDHMDDLAPLPEVTNQQPTWHYKKSKEMCASLASLESMGMCRVDDGRVRFDLSRNYASPTNDPSPLSATEDNLDSPSRIESFDSLSDLAGNSNTFSRNGSSNSIGPGPAVNAHPSLIHSSLATSHHHRNHIQDCGSVDSGYSFDNSIDISSVTDSAHTGMNDSLFTGPRFSIGLNASKHCNPEHSNIFMKPSTEFTGDTVTPVQDGCTMHIEADENLSDELERTAMKRQESDASCVSTAVRPPTTYRSDTLDSNATPFGGSEGSTIGEGGGGSDGGDTLTRRRRSGAFSYHGRSSHTSDDFPMVDSRSEGRRTGTLERGAAKKLAKQRQRQVAGQEEQEEEDEVFCKGSQDNQRHSSPVGLSPVPCVPEVRVSCSPPPLPSSWGNDSDIPFDLTGSCPVDFPDNLDVPEEVNVEESLSPTSLHRLKEQRSLLAEKLQNSSLRNHAGLPSTPLDDYTELDMPSLEDFHLAERDTEAHTTGLLGECSAETHTQPVQDFGQSLFAGHSPTYLPDFVLHGTSEPGRSFQPKLERHLASMVKHSTVDDPIEHGVAIVADTDTWTCKLMVASRDAQTNDVEMAIAPVRLSRYVKLMMASFRGMWEMRMPPDFCLSHLEDRLLELNERGLLLANNLMDYGNDVDISEVLPPTFKALSIRENDQTLLLALAGVHCLDPDLQARLNHTFIRRTLATHK